MTVSRREGIIFETPPHEYTNQIKSGFNMPSGKIECYSEQSKNAGRGALPVSEPPFRDSSDDAVQKKSSLVATSRRPAEVVHTKLANLLNSRTVRS